MLPEQMGDVTRDRRVRRWSRQPSPPGPPGRREHRRTAEAVADQQRWRLPHLAQMIGGAHQVGDIGRERGVGEIAFAGAEAGEVEAQHRDARAVSASEMRFAASTSLPQVKQCANSA